MKTKIITATILILLCFTAISCNQEIIFYDIAREVKLVNPEINGNVYSIVPFAGKLYVQNGNIYEKANNTTAHGWTLVSKAAGMGNIIRLASDENALYAMDEAARNVWARPSGSTTWTKVAENVTELFDNQAVDASLTTTGRSAYITVGTQVKQLSGTEAPAAITVTDTFGRTGEANYIRAAVSDGTDTIFSSNSAICVSGTTLYSADKDSKTIRYKKQGETWTNGGTVSDSIKSICAYGTDKILAGTDNGYEISTINSSTKAPSNGENSSTNAESAFGRNRQIITIRAFGTTIYAGVASAGSSMYSKLWGWFGESWNYE